MCPVKVVFYGERAKKFTEFMHSVVEEEKNRILEEKKERIKEILRQKKGVIKSAKSYIEKLLKKDKENKVLQKEYNLISIIEKNYDKYVNSFEIQGDTLMLRDGVVDGVSLRFIDRVLEYGKGNIPMIPHWRVLSWK